MPQWITDLAFNHGLTDAKFYSRLDINEEIIHTGDKTQTNFTIYHGSSNLES